MSYADTLTDATVMVKRCVRRSLRDPEALFTALTLPVVSCAVRVRLRRRTRTRRPYRRLRRARTDRAVRRLRGRYDAVAVAADMSGGIIDRFRSMPIASSSILFGHVVASLARNLTATALVVGAGLLVGWHPTASPEGWLAAAGVIVVFIFALSWLAAAVGLLARSPRRPTRSRSCSCSCPTSAPRSCRLERCRPCSAGSPRTSRPPRSSRRCAGCGWVTHPPGRRRPRAVAIGWSLPCSRSPPAASWLFRHRTAV